MASVKELQNGVLDCVELRSNDLHKEIRLLQYAHKQYARTAATLVEILPEINKSLNTVGLSVTNISYSQTGNKYWANSTSLKVSIHAMPSSAKFKFIAFNGYKANGSGKNEARLQEKAQKIEKAVLDHTRVVVEVNQYSLEIRDKGGSFGGLGDKTKEVLISLWIK